MRPSRTVAPAQVLRRARQHQRDRGAIIFIVAMTLSLLAAMGVYALTATSSEMRTSGYARQSTQAHYVTEYASQATNDVISPENASFYDNQMTLNVNVGTVTCESAAPKATDPSIATEISKRCVKFSQNGLADIWRINRGATVTPFGADAFAPSGSPVYGAQAAEFKAEITEPISNGLQPGFDVNNGKCFRKYTVTAIGSLRDGGGSGRILAREAGRSRIVAGPFDCGG
jgi:Tfp pilus assembly protein PilX